MPRKNTKPTRKTTKKRSKRNSSNKASREQWLKKEILALMKAKPGKTFTGKQIRSRSGIWSEVSINKIRKLMEELAASGQLQYLDKGKYQYGGESKELTGKIQVTRSGAGFLLMDEGDDIFISSSNIGKAMNGDTVQVKVVSRRKRSGKPEGKVIQIVQRARVRFVGTIEESMKQVFFFLPDDPRLNIDFYLPKEALNGAEPGQKVVVEMVKWERNSPEGKVVQVLGVSGEHNTEMHAILLQYGFEPEFPPEVEAEAEQIPEKIPAQEIAKRRDFRDIPTFTIDPDDAKDFDDALSFRLLENGHYEVGVHIADVSHYVRPGSEIDKEGFQRATSVYLVDRTIPMLPEKLSNRLCSLRPQEEKLTYSAVFEMDEEANIYTYWVGQTVIFSDHRFTYDGAQAVLEGTSEGPFQEEVQTLDKLAKTLRKKRMQTGSIEFGSTEVKFVLDEEGKPVGVKKKEMKDANRLIEDFMLLANRTVSAHIFKLKDNPPLPSVYRIHDQPDQEKLAALQNMARTFGHEVNFAVKGDPSEQLNQLLTGIKDRPEKNMLETLAIRTMAKAVYSTKNIGHFGLGFPFYSHFTSPIRRYPDLMIHRLLTAYHNGAYHENPVVMETQLKHCSEKERTAAEAERASIKYKQVEFLEDKIGETFDGVISGMIEAGFFVELSDNLCEGLVPVSSLDDDYYQYIQDEYVMVGRATGNILRLGDKVQVKITGTDLQRRTIDMNLVKKLELEEGVNA